MSVFIYVDGCVKSQNGQNVDNGQNFGKNKKGLKPFTHKKLRLARFERATYPLKGECSTC